MTLRRLHKYCRPSFYCSSLAYKTLKTPYATCTEMNSSEDLMQKVDFDRRKASRTANLQQSRSIYSFV